MNFNITAEGVSAYIALLLGFFVSINAVKRSRRTKLFICSTFSAAGCAIIDVASVFCIKRYDIIPLWLNHIVNIAYFISLAVVCAFVSFYYLEAIGGSKAERRMREKLIIIPGAIACLIYITSPWTKLIYYFDDAGYQRGPLNVLTYVIMLYMLSIVLGAAYKHRMVITKHVKTAVISFPILMVLATSVQFIDKDMLVTGLAVVGPLILTYLFFENDVMDIDSHTGFGRHSAFVYRTKRLIEKKKPFTCAIISFNNALELYDTVGRDRVREMLIRIATQIERTLPETTHCFRFTENDLTFVDTEIDPESSMLYAKSIADKSLFGSDSDVSLLHISIGMVSFPEAAQNFCELEELLGYASAKAASDESGIFICTGDTRLQINRRRDILNILKTELSSEDNHFEVFYQPIYDINTCRFRTAEALVRLNDTPIGPIYPDEFIPVAEEMGMIEQLGAIVLEKTCRYMSELTESGIDFDAISVNFSVHQIMRKNIVEEVWETVEKYRIPPEKLRIEITERVVIDSYKHIKKIMEQLGEKGVKFYMDDFGTGYSNLANMLKLPFEYLKIDKSLIRASAGDEKTYSILCSLSRAFSAQNVKVLAEGVENQQHKDIAESIGAEYIQGYLFSRPVPGNVAAEYFHGCSANCNGVSCEGAGIR